MPAALLLAALLAAPPAIPSLDRARALQAEGRWTEALQTYRAVADAADTAAVTDPSTVATARNNACVLLNEMGDFKAALVECEAALRIRRALNDPPRIARTLSNTGLCLHSLGEFGEAEARFREALEVSRLRGDAEGQVANLSNLGLVATSQGRYHRALERHTGASALAFKHIAEPWAEPQVLLSQINQGIVREKMGDWPTALALLQPVLDQEDRLDPRRRAALRVDAGIVHRNLGNPEKALENLRAALALYESQGDKAGMARAWLDTGLVHQPKEPRAAEEAYRTALRLAVESGDPAEASESLYDLGQLYLDQGRAGEAEAAFRRGLEAARASGSPEGVWSALGGLARLAAVRGEDDKALKLLDEAMAAIEASRGTLRRSALQPFAFGEKRSAYIAAIELLVRLEARQQGAGYAETALTVLQELKVRELQETLGGAGTVAALDAGQLRDQVGDGVLLEYFAGGRNLLLWVVREKSVTLADLGPARPILDDALAVHAALARSQEPDPARLARLSATLLGPAGKLRGDVKIAADGELRYLPFDLLTDSSGTPVIEAASTSSLPAGSALGWLRHLDDSMPVYTLAGVGAPVVPPGTQAGDFAAAYRLPPLSEAGSELQSLTKQLPGRHVVLLGPQDTESELRQVIYNGIRIAHFASHAVVDDRPGQGAAILFTPADEDNGLLYPEEIAEMTYRADLSILPHFHILPLPGARSGDALNALTGSFLAAGSPAVLVSLWDVEDGARAAFLKQLYAELGDGRRPADALRRTRQHLRDDPRWRRPDQWAGFVLVGSSPRVAYTNRMRYVFGIAALAALALAPWLLDRKPRRWHND